MMSFMDDSTAPSPEFLRQLRANLPSMAKDVVSGKRRGIPVPPTVPRKVCRICEKGFDLAAEKIDGPIVTDACPDCDARLKEGFTAIKTSGRYAFVKSARLDPGTVLHVSKNVMDKIAEHFEAEWSGE
jgi:predicted nucleic acid-binding Zn ribbon protein